MKITILKETAPYETRVAATPETVKRFVQLGFTVAVEEGAGEAAFFPDSAYRAAGAHLSRIPLELIADADIVLKVQPSHPSERLDESSLMKENSLLIGLLSPFSNRELLVRYAERKINSFALEFLPRITRAQSMDALSSQSNLAGYKAVLEAAYYYPKAIPMMMTAAGTITPARVLVLGAGVAGLQAIATAKRLGAIVSAFDVRPAAREQVASLGAQFIEVASHEAESAETGGGYAREMSAEYKQKQQALIHEHIAKSDMVIATALIPGKPAPILIEESMVRAMKPGSVIVDLAASGGGNCAVTQKDAVIHYQGVTVIGHSNFPALLPSDASKLYAKNLLNFVELFIDKTAKSLHINKEDTIIKQSLITCSGEIIHPLLATKSET